MYPFGRATHASGLASHAALLRFSLLMLNFLKAVWPWPAQNAVGSTWGATQKAGHPPGRGREARFRPLPAPGVKWAGLPPTPPTPPLHRSSSAPDAPGQQRGTSLGTAPHHPQAVLLSAPGLCPRSLHPKGPEGERSGQELGASLPLCGSPSELAVPRAPRFRHRSACKRAF